MGFVAGVGYFVLSQSSYVVSLSGLGIQKDDWIFVSVTCSGQQGDTATGWTAGWSEFQVLRINDGYNNQILYQQAPATPPLSLALTFNQVTNANVTVVVYRGVKNPVFTKGYRLATNPLVGLPGNQYAFPEFTIPSAGQAIGFVWGSQGAYDAVAPAVRNFRYTDPLGVETLVASLDVPLIGPVSDFRIIAPTYYAWAMIAIEAAPPESPASFTATADAVPSVHLAWSAAPYAGTYTLERSLGTGAGPYTTIATGLTGLIYTDLGVEYLTTYTYRLTAVNNVGSSDPVTATVTTPPEPFSPQLFTLSSPTPTPKPNAGLYIVQQGDRIERLAARLLGDPSRFRDLVNLNNLDYPYISDDPAVFCAPGARVLTAGDALYYPLDTEAVGVTSETPTPPDLEAEMYGRDLKLKDGYVVVQGGTLALVAGLENFRDALYRRLNTPLGNLPAHPTTYGHTLRDYIGLTGTAIDQTLMQLEVERCLRQDSRVSDSVTLSTVLQRDLAEITARIETAVFERPLPTLECEDEESVS